MRRGSRLCGGSWYSCTGIGNRDGGAFGGWRGVRSARGRLPSPAMLVVVFEGPCSRESGVAYQNYYPGSTRFLFTELFPNQNYKKSRYKTTERPQSAIVQRAAAVIMLHGIASSKPPLRRSSKARGSLLVPGSYYWDCAPWPTLLDRGSREIAAGSCGTSRGS